jgi:hypothetical protein
VVGRLLIFDSSSLTQLSRAIPRVLAIIGLVAFWFWNQGRSKRNDALGWIRSLEHQGLEIGEYLGWLSDKDGGRGFRIELCFEEPVEVEQQERLVGAVSGFLDAKQTGLGVRGTWVEQQRLRLEPVRREAGATGEATSREVHEWFYSVVGLCVPVIRTQARIEKIGMVRVRESGVD